MFLIYSPDSTDIYGARGGEIEGAGSLEVMQVVKSRAYPYSVVQTLLLWDVSFSHNAQADGQTDAQAIVSCQ